MQVSEVWQGYCYPEFPQNCECGLHVIILLEVNMSQPLSWSHIVNKREPKPGLLSKPRKQVHGRKKWTLSAFCLACYVFHCLSLSFRLLIFTEQTQWPSSAVNRTILVGDNCFLPHPPNNDSIQWKQMEMLPPPPLPPSPETHCLGNGCGRCCLSPRGLHVMLLDLPIFYYVRLLVLFRRKLFPDYNKGCPLLPESS